MNRTIKLLSFFLATGFFFAQCTQQGSQKPPATSGGIGFGHSSAFGSPIKMPTLEKLAAKGLKYNRFHTSALCSPATITTPIMQALG